MANIKTLRDLEGNVIYPRTVLTAVDGMGQMNIPIEQGGTSGSTRKEGYNNLAFLGVDPISTEDNDTTSNWINLGSGYAFYTDSSSILGKPSGWGFLINWCYGGDVFQVWNVQNEGSVYYRSGNGLSGTNGWGCSWKKLYDSTNITISTSAPSGGSNGDLWIQY